MAAQAEVVGETLTRQYRLSCELLSTYPLPCFTHQLSRGRLDLHLDTLDLDHLEALCHTLKNKMSPSSLRVIVPAVKEVPSMMVRVVERAIEGVAVCVVASHTLFSLSLDGVRLRGRTLKVLCEGLRKARTLNTLVMKNCVLGDSGTESVCQAVKNVPSITHLSLVNCGVGERGGTSVACLIKHQRLNRDSAMWQDTLRQRRPNLDGMKGLRRLTLNSNPAFGDKGVAAIAEALTEDLWIKAVDLQHCGVSEGGGASLRTLLHTNQTLEVVDVRNNPFMLDTVVGELTHLLHGRSSEASMQYGWLKSLDLEEKEEKEATVGMLGQHRGGTAGYKSTGRVMKAKRGRQLPHFTTSRRPKPPSQLGIPWRVEHRLYERKEGLVPGSMVSERVEACEGVEKAPQSSRETISDEDAIREKIRKKMQLYKKKYQKERKHRQKLEHKLTRIQTQLQGLHTLDEATLSHIEECFLKFHIFLTTMQNSREELQPSSSGTVSPLHSPHDSYRVFLPEASTSHHPITTPVSPAIHPPIHASTSQRHPIPARPEIREDYLIAVGLKDKYSAINKNEDNNKNSRAERNVIEQEDTSHDSENDSRGKNDITSMSITSNQHEIKIKGERIRPDFSNGEQERMDRGITRTDKSERRKKNTSSNGQDSSPLHLSFTPVKHETQTIPAQLYDDYNLSIGEVEKSPVEYDLMGLLSADSLVMRVEIKENEKEGITDRWNNGMKSNHRNEMNGKKNQCLRTNEYVRSPSKEISKHTNSKDICILQGHTEAELYEGGKPMEESYQSTKPRIQVSRASQSSHSSQSPPASHNQSFLPTQSSSRRSSLIQSPERHSQSPLILSPPTQSQLTQSSPRQSLVRQSSVAQSPERHLQLTQSPKKQSPLIQSPTRQSQLTQSPPGQSSPRHSQLTQSPGKRPSLTQSFQKINSPERIKSPEIIKSPQNWSPRKAHLTEKNDSPQRNNSPPSQSPRRTKSPRKAPPPPIPSNEVSETDDEKMKNLSAWLQGRTRGRGNISSSSSSVSISEQLQQSHSSWTKSRGRSKGGRVGLPVEEGEEEEEIPGGSEFDLSDLEDLSLSGVTLTNTSVPEDAHTPREEAF